MGSHILKKFQSHDVTTKSDDSGGKHASPKTEPD